MDRFVEIRAEQRSDAWRLARIGRLTGSVAADMLATVQKGESAKRRDLRMRLVCERLTGQPQESGFVNAEMQRGIDCEPLAIGAYETRTGRLVRTSGFLQMHDLSAGCSLDGHFGDFEGILELKCPKSATHLAYLRTGMVPADYLPQITHNLWVTGAQWCDFLSWDDRFPEDLQTFLVRVTRDDVDLVTYEKKARAFLAEVEAEYRSLLGWKEAASA